MPATALQDPLASKLDFNLEAPGLFRRILAGSQPADLTLERLIRKGDLPLSWREQTKLFG